MIIIFLTIRSAFTEGRKLVPLTSRANRTQSYSCSSLNVYPFACPSLASLLAVVKTLSSASIMDGLTESCTTAIGVRCSLRQRLLLLRTWYAIALRIFHVSYLPVAHRGGGVSRFTWLLPLLYVRSGLQPTPIARWPHYTEIHAPCALCSVKSFSCSSESCRNTQPSPCVRATSRRRSCTCRTGRGVCYMQREARG